jgi:cellulose synthase/poly-beta-1,6-N-acetylglucosamine synthase-like glycosyltransferase
MFVLSVFLIVLAAGLLLYTYVGYPLILRILARRYSASARVGSPPEIWPTVSICLPAYNEEAQIRGAVESLLSLDYPADRLQILVVSDASSDRTDEIVREYSGRGVELLRMDRRGGKTAAENAAAAHLRGEIIINTDASIRIRPDALKPLVAPFQDPTVGVSSGRDVSVASDFDDANAGESGYVGYEMQIRSLETRLGGIVGASGCFYAIRPHLHSAPIPQHLSRDFASALTARDHGYRAVSVDEAVCLVPRTSSLRREYRRKVRTMTRGMQTLHFKRHLLNPFRHGVFAWMLFSHKVCRWVLPWALLGGALGITLLASEYLVVRVVLALGVGVVLLAAVGWFWPESRPMPRILGLPAFAVTGNLAAIHSAIRALHGDVNPTWEPTRREAIMAARELSDAL